MSDAALCLLVLVAVIALFVWNRLPVELVAVGSALALYALGLVSGEEVFAGFGDPVIAFIAGLFIVSEGLNASGVTAWAGRQLISRAGPKRTQLLTATMLLAAGMTALISVNGATAALLPMVVLLAVRLGRSPSGLAMPLAFAGHAGSLLVLTATPINVLVSEAAAEGGGRAFGFFEFALVGVPLVAGTVALTVLSGRKLLPERQPRSLPSDLSGHARTLARQYQVDGTDLITREAGVAELVLTPRSALIGDTVYPGMTTDSGELVVLAVHRNSQALDAPTQLKAGDVLLVQGTWAALERHVRPSADLLVVDSPADVRRQAVPLGQGARRAIAIVAAMVVLLATGVVPPAVAAILAAGAMLLTRVLTMRQAYAGLSLTTLVLVAGMIPLSVAMRRTGAADQLADLVVGVFGGNGYLLVLGIFLLTAVLGQVVSNTATALIVIPIGIAAAHEVGVSVQPVMMCVAIAGAAAFLTPIATPANLMVMQPGGYRFGDYWRLGAVLLLWFLVVAVGLVPLLWTL